MNGEAKNNPWNIVLKNKKSKIEAGLLGVALLIVAASIVWAFIEPGIIKVTEIEIVDSDLPKALDGLKIAHLSDIHHRSESSVGFLRKVIDKTNSLSPDLIFLTGDYTWGRNVDGGISLFEQLGRLKSRYGMYTVFGNHDSSLRKNEVFLKKLSDAKITVLENKAKWLEINGAKIKVGGVGDVWSWRQDIAPTIDDVLPGDFVVLLSHNPDYAREVPEEKIDLVLCGHTHGGQVTFLGLYAPHLPIKGGQKYRSGLVEKGDMKIIVSKGIGTIGPKMRFFAMPEIVLITLRHEVIS